MRGKCRVCWVNIEYSSNNKTSPYFSPCTYEKKKRKRKEGKKEEEEPRKGGREEGREATTCISTELCRKKVIPNKYTGKASVF